MNNKLSQMSRRDFLKFSSYLTAGALVSSCTKGQPAATEGAPTAVSLNGMTINYLGWEGYDFADALKPLVDPNQMTVNSTYGGNNEEIFSKLKAGSPGQYDVVSIYFGNVPDLIDNDLVQPLDPSRLEHYNDIYDYFKNVSFNKRNDNIYSFPFTFGTSTVIYNPEFVPNGIKSWNELFQPEYTQKIVQNDNWAELWIGLMMTGGDIGQYMTKTQLNDAKQWLLSLKPQIRAIMPSYGEMTDAIVRNDAWLTTFGWDLQINQAAEKGVTLKACIPDEGCNAWCDNYLIPKGANLDAAYAFINQMTSPEGAASLATYLSQQMSNKKVVSLLPAEMQTKYDNLEETLKKTPFPPNPPHDPTDANIASFAEVTAAWEEYKSA